MSREYVSEVYELGLEREGPISKLECKGGYWNGSNYGGNLLISYVSYYIAVCNLFNSP